MSYTTSPIFVTEEKDELFKRLENLYLNFDTGMTKEKFLKVEEQLGRKPDLSKMPPDMEDFPLIVQEAIHTFNMLGDRSYPEIGYTGKDYTNLPIYLNLFEIKDLELFLEILAWLDARAIKKSSDKIRKEYEKLKSKK